MTNDQTRDRHNDNSRRELSDDLLAQISGGRGIVSPRDAASGLPTGKRF
jgi:hypothetical protein